MINSEQRLHESGLGETYDYDGLHRLKSVSYSVPKPYKSVWLNFDSADNIRSLSRIEKGVSKHIDASFPNMLNQYRTFNDWGMLYDQNGNPTRKGTQEFEYDNLNRLVSAEGLTGRNTYVYDVLGRRLGKTMGVRTYQVELKREVGGEWYLSSFFPAPPEGWMAGDIVPDNMVRKPGALALEGLNFLTIKTRRRGGRRYTQYFRFFVIPPNVITGSVSDAPQGSAPAGFSQQHFRPAQFSTSHSFQVSLSHHPPLQVNHTGSGAAP